MSISKIQKKSGVSYRSEIYVYGNRETKVFDRKIDAERWQEEKKREKTLPEVSDPEKLKINFTNFSEIATLYDAEPVFGWLIEQYQAGVYTKIVFCSTTFISALVQKVEFHEVLPLRFRNWKKSCVASCRNPAATRSSPAPTSNPSNIISLSRRTRKFLRRSSWRLLRWKYCTLFLNQTHPNTPRAWAP